MAKSLTDEELASICDERIGSGVGLGSGKLSLERTTAQKFYDAQLPRPAHAGSSKYVSQDVVDAVDTMKAQILETFTGNMKPIRARPQGSEDATLAEDATTYIDYVIFRQNPGYFIFHDVIHDGLMARLGVAKVYWDKREETEESEADISSPEELAAVLSDPSAEPDDYDEDPETGAITRLKFTRSIDRSQIVIEPVAPEEFGIAPRTKDPKTAEYCFHRFIKSASELRAMGVPKATLKDLTSDKGSWVEDEEEVIQRTIEVEDSLTYDPEASRQEAARRFIIHEVYLKVDMEGDGKVEMWKVTKAGKSILFKERVRRSPFVFFTPLRKPHTAWGSNYARRVMPTQVARTTLMRGILDHTQVTNNPRYQVVNGTLRNPKELMENRMGGIVNVARPDGIMPLPQAALNPYVYQTIALLDDDKEETTGISKLSQGLNKDAISSQNSNDMVMGLVGLSQGRQKMIARNFANGFLKDLFLEVYLLMIENETPENIQAVTGRPLKVEPGSWPELRDFEVEFRVGHGEQDKESEKYLKTQAYIAGAPVLSQGAGYPQQYAAAKRAMEAAGIKDIDTFLLPPDKVQPPPPDPAAQLQMQAQAKELEIRERQQKVAELKAQKELEEFQHKARMEMMKLQLELEMKRAEFTLDNAEFKHKVQIDNREMDIAEKAAENAPELEARATISPNG